MAEDTAQTTEMESGTDIGEAVGMETEDASQEQTEDALSERDRRLATLEETLGQRDARIVHLEAALGQAEDAAKRREEEIEGVNGRLAQAVELYRGSLLASEPDVPEDMVQGIHHRGCPGVPRASAADGGAGARPYRGAGIPGAHALGRSGALGPGPLSAVAPGEDTGRPEQPLEAGFRRTEPARSRAGPLSYCRTPPL